MYVQYNTTMGHSKPDIAYALNVLSRYCNNPGRFPNPNPNPSPNPNPKNIL